MHVCIVPVDLNVLLPPLWGDVGPQMLGELHLVLVFRKPERMKTVLYPKPNRRSFGDELYLHKSPIKI